MRANVVDGRLVPVAEMYELLQRAVAMRGEAKP